MDIAIAVIVVIGAALFAVFILEDLVS